MHYKSFVRCDDPKGVVECSAFRRSLSASDKMEIKSKSHKTQKRPDANATNSAEKREVLPQGIKNESCGGPSSFQLLEISRGAQKMNSWSKGLERKSHSKEIAKDLLRGALDLQESLLMLGKLQETSHSMAKLKNKQNERFGELRIDGIDERASSTRFGDLKYPIELQDSNFFEDGSSKDTIVELKRVIRDSLAHNLLPNTDSEEETLFSGTHLDSDIPSTSSSQSSTAHGSYFSYCNSMMPMAPPRMAAKGPSLIAKLMGLEDMPSRPLQNTLMKPFQMEKSSNRQMPVFDIDMPKLRKPRYITQMGEQKPRRLEDILESMHFKGLLRSNSMKEAKSHTLYSNDSFHNHNFIHDDPPIVLIKPLNHPWLQMRKPFVLASEEEEALKEETIPRKPKGMDELLVKRNDRKEIKPLNHPWLQTQKPSMLVSEEEETLKAETIPKKLKAKGEPLVKTNDRKEEVVSSSGRLRGKVETKESPAKRHDHGKGAKDGKEKGLKAEVKEAETEKKLLVQKKTSGKTIRKPFKESEDDKISDKTPKIAKTTRKPTEKGISKVKSLSSSQERAELLAPESIKHEKGTTFSRNQSFQHQTPKSSSTSTSETKVHPNGDRLRSSIIREKTSKHKEQMAKIESVRSEGNDKRTEQPSTNESSPTNDCIVTPDQQFADVERTESVDTEIEVLVEQCCDGQSSICNVTELTAEDLAVVRVTEEVKYENIFLPKSSQSSKNGAYLRALLLSDQEFLNHAEGLFDLDVNVPEVSENEGILYQVDACRRLSLDCAKEFIKRRSSPDSQMLHPGSLISIPNMMIQISLDRLLEEVCNGVETLRSRIDVNTENACDGLSAMLERDMKHKEVSSSIWDLGWRNTSSVDDTMHVVNELEDLLLYGLIDEFWCEAW